jgi:DNA mismatch endonuclease (patch repair protein)
MNRNADTRHERLIRNVLWKRGLRYRKNVKTLPGKPDIVFPKAHVAVFCDGDFWHGREWLRLSRKLRSGANGAYWLQKIRSNRVRDRRNTRLLEKDGWTVIRVWETDIRANPEATAAEIEKAIVRHQRARRK